MSRCELHDPLGNQCDRWSVITVMAVVGIEPLEAAALWRGSACSEHGWEACARAAHAVRQARIEGHEDARVVALVDAAGEQLLALVTQGITIGERWPLAKPWVRAED